MLLAFSVIGLSLGDACRCLLQISLRLFGCGHGASDACFLFAVVEASQDRTLCDALANIGAKIDQDTREL